MPRTASSSRRVSITSAATATRSYVIDTSVLLSDPHALRNFHEHEVIVPIVVVTELEAKRHHPELGYFARTALRYLDERSGQWVPLWPVPDVRSRDALPGAVELQLQAAAGEWPPLVVRMAALAPTDPAGSRFTIGGRR